MIGTRPAHERRGGFRNEPGVRGILIRFDKETDTMTKYIAILIGMGLMANSAIAASDGMNEIDTNGDGLMTIDEIQAVFPDMNAETFSQIDANGDGAVDDAEMVAAQEQGLIPASTDG